MKEDNLITALKIKEREIEMPKDLETKVMKKISDFKLLSDIFQHFSDVPIYLINLKEIEGE